MNKKNPAMQFLLEQVVVWLSEKGREDTEHLVEMLFSSLCCCSSQETTRVLNHVTTVLRQSCDRPHLNSESVLTDVCTSLSDGVALENHLANYQKGTCHRAGLHQHQRAMSTSRVALGLAPNFCRLSLQACVDPAALKSCGEWLRGSVLGERLLGLTEQLCRVEGSDPTPAASKCQHSWALISLVLSQHHDGGEPRSSGSRPVSTSSPSVCHHFPNFASFFSNSSLQRR